MIKKLKYLGREIKVEYYKNHSNNVTMGVADTLTDTISLMADLPPDKRLETLFHELIHFVSEDFDLNLNESQVCTLSTVLYGIIKDNIKQIGNV